MQGKRPTVGMAPTALAFYAAASAHPSLVKLGAQDAEIEGEVKGNAITGANAQQTYKKLGADFVIIGHSERRTMFAESDSNVNKKVLAALENGLKPVICVGESLNQRENNETDNVIINQVAKALAGVRDNETSRIVVAYEPLWAINTGKSCDPQEAARVCSLIRNTLVEVFGDVKKANDVSILYGGSVNDKNADSIFEGKDIDGALVGGACLDGEKFLSIVKSLQTQKQ